MEIPIKDKSYGKKEASCEGIGVHDKHRVIHVLLHGCFAYSVDNHVKELYWQQDCNHAQVLHCVWRWRNFWCRRKRCLVLLIHPFSDKTCLIKLEVPKWKPTQFLMEIQNLQTKLYQWPLETHRKDHLSFVKIALYFYLGWLDQIQQLLYFPRLDTEWWPKL